jgi:hypothetical protein
VTLETRFFAALGRDYTAKLIGKEIPKLNASISRMRVDPLAGALNTFHELRYGHFEASRKNFQRPERWIFVPALNVTDVRTAQASMLGEIILIPALCLT